MVTNIEPFIGSWFVNWATGGPDHKLQYEYYFVIGTGEYGATKPFLTEEYKVCVGFAVLNQEGERIFGTGDSDHDPMVLLFTEGALRGAGFYEGQPIRIYIAMAEAQMPGDQLSYAIYGSTYSGDPDQVGVWGPTATRRCRRRRR
jgi:hypothetical protein